MHSSRMRTARLLTGWGAGVVTKSQVGGGGVVTKSQVGGRWLTIGVARLPPKYYTMTDACKNITFARFATRAVKIDQFESWCGLFRNASRR